MVSVPESSDNAKRGVEMSNWEKNIRRVTPYVPGEQPKLQKMIKLNTNENPYPPSPEVQRLLEEMSADTFRLYPDPAASELVQAIACRYGVDEKQIFVGVGSDDVLAMAFLTFFNSGLPVFFPDITYSFYDVWADTFRIPYRQIPLNDRFEICPEDYAAPNGGVIFPNPNAPTGVALEPGSVEQIVRANQDSVVIVDEAYVDFGAVSALPLIRKYDNLLVVQTFSKSRSMAGMRIGFAIGDEKLIRFLQDVKYSFNSYTMNRTAIVLGAAAVRDEAWFRETVGRITATRERTQSVLREMGFQCRDSAANFVFVSHERVPAGDIFRALRERNIFVRYFDRPRIRNYLRITIGTDEEMDRLFAALQEILA